MKYLKKERTQKEIIKAAKDIIHAKGHDAVTVRNLAKATGYSYTILYYYFKDLSSLLWALRLDMIDDMITELTPAANTKEDPVKEIIDIFFCYIEYFFKHPNVFRFFYFYPFIRPKGDDSYQKLEEKFSGIWQISFSRLIQEGIIKADDIEIVAKTIIYSLQGMIMLSLSSNGTMDQKNIKDELVKLMNYLFSKSREIVPGGN